MKTLIRITFALFCVVPASAQTTWYVDVAGTPPGTGTLADPYTSIQYAIAQPATVLGDTLLVAPGVYVENLVISKRVLIAASGGPDVTSLRAAAPGILVRSTAPDIFPFARLRGFTLDGSADPAGSGIWNQNAVLQIERCVIRGFTAGKAIDHQNQYVDLYQTTISGNAVGIQVRHAVDPGVVTLNSCIVRGNGVDVIDPSGGSAINPFFSNLPPAHAGGPGSGNQTVLPGFWDPPEGDLHLKPGSPCIDSGYPGLPPDPDGSPPDRGGLTYSATYAPGPFAFCTAKTNSQGCVPAIGSSGRATSTGSVPFVVHAARVLPGKAGLLLVGPGKSATPFQGGWLCVQTPIQRFGAQVSGGTGACNGTYTFDLAAHLAGAPVPLFSPGALVACQWWGRDFGAPHGTQLTNALYFGVAP